MTCTYHKQSGFVTLMVSSVLLFIISAASFYSANTLITEQRMVTNHLETEQAMHAAEAGLDHAQAYLIANGPGGVTDGQTLSDTLPNSSGYSVQMDYVNGGTDQILITSIGTSANGDVSKTFSEKAIIVGGGGALGFDEPVKATGSVSMVGNGSVYNLITDYTIHSGGSASLVGNAQTVISSGTSSDSSTIGTDIIPNDATLAAVSDSVLFEDHFGTTFANALPSGAVTMTFNGSGQYGGQLNGLSGQVVEINGGTGTVTISKNNETVTIGTAASPVNLVITAGKVKMSGTTIIYGNVITNGEIDMTGNGTIYGSTKSDGDTKFAGNATIHGDALSFGELDMSGNGEVNGAAFSAGDTKFAGNGHVNGAILSGGNVSFVGNGNVVYTQGNVSSYGGGGGTDYARLIGSWRNH